MNRSFWMPRVRLVGLCLVSLVGLTGPAGAQGGESTPVQRLDRDLRRIVREASPCVVTVVANFPARKEKGKPVSMRYVASSGLVLDAKGHIVTPAEPFAKDARVFITSRPLGGPFREFRGRLVGRDSTLNLAVVKILFPPADLVAIRRGPIDDICAGSIVVSLASPYGHPTTSSWGMVMGLDGKIEFAKQRYSGLIMATTPANPGDSGGALVDARGRVVGMLLSTFMPDRPPTKSPEDSEESVPSWRPRNVTFVLPIDRVVASADRIVARQGDVEPPGKRVKRFLGVWGEYLLKPGPISSQLKLPERTGFLVTGLFEGEVAKRHGIQKHDVILRLGDVDIVDTPYSLGEAIRSAPAHQDVPMLIIRGGERMTLTVRFDR
jgi:S1-C subfamily serine protease